MRHRPTKCLGVRLHYFKTIFHPKKQEDESYRDKPQPKIANLHQIHSDSVWDFFLFHSSFPLCLERVDMFVRSEKFTCVDISVFFHVRLLMKSFATVLTGIWPRNVERG